MKVVVAASVLVAIVLGVSGCGSTRPAAGNSSLAGQPKSLRAFVHSTIAGSRVNSLEVYGPGTRPALNRADDGGTTISTALERTKVFYLLVLHGHFVAPSAPAGAKAPTGTVETLIWSEQEGSTDLGIENGVPPGVAKLHKIATITAS